MPEQRRRFSPQFKAEAVQMVIETGKPIAVMDGNDPQTVVALHVATAYGCEH